MEKRIVYINPDNTITVIVPAPSADVDDIVKTQVPEGAAYRILNASELPFRDDYRVSWKVDQNFKVYHDMAIARDVHKDRIRKLRQPKLEALDLKYQRADEDGDLELKKAIVLKKKKLRDLTNHSSIDAAKTIEELKLAALSELE